VKTSWYDKAAGRKRGGARRRAKLCGEYPTFFAPLIILAGRLRARSKPQLFPFMPGA
jgi:hypothetical protein